MSKTAREEELERRIEDLEREIASLRNGVPRRSKIAEMSAEVVDSNPYRYICDVRLSYPKLTLSHKLSECSIMASPPLWYMYCTA